MHFDFEVDGVEGLEIALKEAGDLPVDVRKKMVEAQAKVTELRVIYRANTMLRGPYNKFAVGRSTEPTKPRATKDGASVTIKFLGEQHRNRMGEIAFVNEYGKKSQPARPFIKTAIKDARDPAADAAHKILEDFLKKKGL